MAKIKKYVISETGEFPAQYMVLRSDNDGIYRPVLVLILIQKMQNVSAGK